MASIQRRALVQGATLGALAFTIGGVELMLTPREARAQNAPLKTLSADDARRLEAVSETLVPGARENGIANFIDQQCSIPPHEALLGLRIANARPPFVNFYRAALAAIDAQAQAQHQKVFAELGGDDQHEFINQMRQAKFTDWSGPPQPQIYTVFRDDAVDVVYGTVDGFKRLGVPYMPHVAPKTRW